MYLLMLVLFGLLCYVSFVAYAKDAKVNLTLYKQAFKAWKSFSKEDFKVLAKDAHKSPRSLRSMYTEGYEIIFYPITGLVAVVTGAIRKAHHSATV